VTNHGVESGWSTQTVAFGFLQPEAGGFRAFGERRARYGLIDFVFGGSAYRRLGDWTVAGAVEGSPDATFWFRRAVEGELHRRVAGGWVASAAYRFMAFPAVDVHQAQPAITWYNARGEVQLRAFMTRNSTLDRTTWAALLRASVRLDPRFTLIAAAAGGDRIFDIASLAGDAGSGSWTVRGGLRIAVTPRNHFEVDAGFAGENPSFRQRTLAVSYRRAF
jgi:YaiO family outer membrane protein